MQNEVFDWVGGAFVHNHFRIDDLVAQLRPDKITEEMATYMNRYRDGSFSLGAISTYLENIFGQNILITDTQHPSYVLSEDYDNLEDEDKIQFFNKEVQEATVDLLTQCILERKRVIRQFSNLSHVLNGVEVDILSPNGGLTVRDEALSQLDYVTASFHSSIYYAAGNESPKTTGAMNMYNHVVANPNVDAISHPTFYLPQQEKLIMTPTDWSELFVNMSKNKVAFEINLDSTNLVYDRDGTNLDRNLLMHALKAGVPLVIGFDFHYIADWGGFPSPLLLINEDEIKIIIKEHHENGTISRLLARVLGNMYALKQMGIEPSNIVNSNDKLFKNWLAEREG